MVLSKRQISPYFLFALLLLLGWATYRIVGVFLDYILLALVLAYITYPIYRWLLKRIRYPPVASLMMVTGVGATVLVPLALVSYQLVKEIATIVQRLGQTDLQATLDAWVRRFSGAVGRDPESDQSTRIVETVQTNLEGVLIDWLTGIGPVILEALVGVFVMLYVLYYAFTNGQRFLDYLRDTLPMQEPHRDLLFFEVGSVVRAVLYGTVLTSLIQAVLGGIGFALFGVPNVVFWSVVMFILALLPIIGPPLVWGPWGIYLMLVGETFRGVGLLVYSAVMVSTVDNIVRPKLIGTQAHVHPVIILLGVLGGLVVFGFSGFLLGPLVLSVFVTILNVYRKEFAMKMDEEAPPPHA